MSIRRKGETNTTKAAYYGRVSTADQVEGTSLDSQQERCLKAIHDHGWRLAGEYVDEGVSGAKGSRPELDSLMAACRAGEVDAVVVAKLDRFGRSVRHLSRLIGDLDDLGIIFVSVAESFDSSTPAGRLMRNMLGSFAEFERDQIRDRTMSGLIEVAKQGYWAGGPPPYGFRLDKNADGSGHTRLALDENESAMLHLAVSEILGGKAVWDTALLLNELGYRPRSAKAWSYHLLRRILRDSQISGTWSYGRPYGCSRGVDEGEFTVSVPAIITPEQHAELRAILTTNNGPQSERQQFYLLSKGVLISPCGRPMRGKSRRDRGSYKYQCPSSESVAGVARCECKGVPGLLIEDTVWTEVKRLLSDPERLLELADSYLDKQLEAGAPEDIGAIDRSIDELETARTTTATQYMKAGVAPDLVQAAVAEIDRELSAWRRRGEGARSAVRGLGEARGRLERLHEMTARAVQRLEKLSPEEQRIVLDALELRVQIDGWDECTTCGGTGKLKGGRGGTRCPTCGMVKAVPHLRLTGIWTSDLDTECGVDSGQSVDAPHTGALVRFDSAHWPGLAGATRPG